MYIANRTFLYEGIKRNIEWFGAILQCTNRLKTRCYVTLLSFRVAHVPYQKFPNVLRSLRMMHPLTYFSYLANNGLYLFPAKTWSFGKRGGCWDVIYISEIDGSQFRMNFYPINVFILWWVCTLTKDVDMMILLLEKVVAK